MRRSNFQCIGLLWGSTPRINAPLKQISDGVGVTFGASLLPRPFAMKLCTSLLHEAHQLSSIEHNGVLLGQAFNRAHITFGAFNRFDTMKPFSYFDNGGHVLLVGPLIQFNSFKHVTPRIGIG